MNKVSVIKFQENKMELKTDATNWYLPIRTVSTEAAERTEWDLLKPNVILGCCILGVFILTAIGNES